MNNNNQIPRAPLSTRKKVGNIKEYITTVAKDGKSRKTAVPYSYRDVEYDDYGWADSKKYLPEDFDLVYMKLARERIITGWINGTHWCGVRLKQDDKVLFWKRDIEEVEK